MAITEDATRTYIVTGAGTAVTVAHTFDSANPKVVVVVTMEDTGGFSVNPAIDGNAMTQEGSATTQGNCTITRWYYDSSLSSGSKNLTYTTTNSTNTKGYCQGIYGAASGAPEASLTDTEAASVGTAVGDAADITVTEGAYLLAVVMNAFTSPTISSWGTFTTADSDSNTGGDRVAVGVSAGETAGAKSVDCTFSNNTGDKVLVAMSFAAAAAASSGGAALVGGTRLVG